MCLRYPHSWQNTAQALCRTGFLCVSLYRSRRTSPFMLKRNSPTVNLRQWFKKVVFSENNAMPVNIWSCLQQINMRNDLENIDWRIVFTNIINYKKISLTSLRILFFLEKIVYLILSFKYYTIKVKYLEIV